MHKPEGSSVFAFIEKKRSEGKCAKKSMIAGLNKFLRVYYRKVSEINNGIFLDSKPEVAVTLRRLKFLYVSVYLFYTFLFQAILKNLFKIA